MGREAIITGAADSSIFGPGYFITVPSLGVYATHREDGKRRWVTPYQIEPLNPPKQQETVSWDEACFDRDGRYREPVYAERAA